MDFAVIKMATLCFGFLLVFVGALFLLKLNQVSYALELSGHESKISMQTASLGLVLATLGVISILVTINRKSYLSVKSRVPSPLPIDDISMHGDIGILFEERGTDISRFSTVNIKRLCNFLKNNDYPVISLEGFGNRGLSAIEYSSMGQRRSSAIRDRLLIEVNTPLLALRS
ncbi:hypothetical protein MARGE09_P4047 [Marinagarivorans cellulosilyticus]|uniref:Uncharacterized protein n=1 Tax=Marinagarivorans cellulosilyticus TaxID=2721545 RepID=A0AAN1WLM7_9GAMM|nr:hypothetical protein MARGE09_P4047 [Marinagarivorans cellulosilyticus]